MPAGRRHNSSAGARERAPEEVGRGNLTPSADPAVKESYEPTARANSPHLKTVNIEIQLLDKLK